MFSCSAVVIAIFFAVLSGLLMWPCRKFDCYNGPCHAVADSQPEVGSKDGLLRFLTYNVFARPPGVATHGNDYKDERLALLAQKLQDYDVVCLQELFSLGSCRRAKFIAEAKARGLHYSATANDGWTVSPLQLVDGGVVILSRFPILATEFKTFSKAAWDTIDSIVGKGVLWAKVQHPDTDVNVLCTHVQACDNERGYHRAVRSHQIKEIAAFREKVAGDQEHPTILAGDLNVNSRSGDKGSSSVEYGQTMEILSANGTVSIQDVLREHTGKHPVTCDGCPINRHVPRASCPANRHERLDYILLNNGAKSALRCLSSVVREFAANTTMPFVRLSDHLAVEAVFAVVRPSQAG